ncbi:tetrafunctional fatty acid synthase subunit FAS1 [Sugiyamaella lignohabitans]|uniref:Fatty acid synthase subunit beta n=1 Tax=Sugiyamaella lignohabitans TaxID=796027 RepID=A0A167D8A8_9ASCO|nr:tetrafunctional fatty acid synthase subunit FAS1 [Sugiyamaella lignohabitans]ANB12603.1 tetrafunctional fatty acid synthase subunit FAS1 [Sugiyamaella lignohabitans]
MYATGVSTPQSAASLRPLMLSHGDIEHTLLVPTSLYLNCSQLRDQYLATLPPPTEGNAGDDEPASSTELLADFLGFTSTLVDEEPGPYDDVLALVLTEFESRYLQGNDVHAVAAALQTAGSEGEASGTTVEKIKKVVKSYYSARLAANRPIKSHDSALLRAAGDDRATLHAIFGGQGNTEDYFEELRDIYNVYNGTISDFIELVADKLLQLSREHSDANKIYTKGLDILRWLNHPETTPDNDYLISAPISVPVIGVIQLAHYAITCRVLGKTPGEFREYLSGATGHSQGLVTAVTIASSDSWESFFDSALKAMTIFFYIGLRCQQQYPHTSLPPSVLEDSVAEGEGKPSPMLSVRDLSQEQLQKFVDITNQHLPKEKHIVISLINGARNMVVTGPPQSLYGLNLTLRKAKAPTGLNQGRVPHSQRKLRFSNRFLPITSPFHSPLLTDATDIIVSDLKSAGVEFTASGLAIPVYDTYDGSDFRSSQSSIVARVIELITHLPVNWEIATKFSSTHILDFGPGGLSGLGLLTHRNKDGTGVRVILAGVLDGSASQEEFGYKQELFDREEGAVRVALDWVKEFSPKLIKTKSGVTYVDTKFSRLLGRPPLMVPGMTPTTVRPEFVAATLNAGYHIELGGGGYFMPSMLTAALEKIKNATKPGVGITLNVLYVNPVMLQWCIPLIENLRKDGFPIEGLTIGAGVPSLDVANEYIRNLGLKHISFKPGTVESIATAVSIAAANPSFPVIIQWTGGRGGGHHSFEDFHAPVLQMYSKIRRQPNIILVGGSGFGSAEDTYPYLTGEWSTKFNYPPMPFDGFLLGSRVMVAKETFTSPDAKKAIVNAPGVADKDWEKTYKGATGGIITVNSEMGEPIHKLATRGVLFWHELDNMIFSLPKNKRVEVLASKRDYIIKRLNDDFQKTWFGRDFSGKVVDLEDMTYGEVVSRCIDLLFVKKEKRWIDTTLRNFTGDFIRRLEERFTTESGKLSVLQSYSQLDEPFGTLDRVLEAYPEAKTQIINAQDKDYFLLLCRRPTQKPVPFIPALDDNFEFYFKKDSLWQSEDLAAVVGEDVGRTCILHGPVAAKFSAKIDEPIQDILDGIHNGHIEKLLSDFYGGDASKVPVIESFGGQPPKGESDIEFTYSGVTVLHEGDNVVYKIDANASDSAFPSLEEWINLVAGETYSWRYSLLSANIVVQGTKHQPNPLKQVLAPVRGLKVEITDVSKPDSTAIKVYEPINGKLTKVVEISKSSKDVIKVHLIEHRTYEKKPVAMELLYTYQPELGYAPIQEVMEGRNQRVKDFYWKVWFGSNEKTPIDLDVTKPWDGDSVTVEGKAIADFVHAVGNNGEAFVERPNKVTYAPMDFAIVTGWKAIIKAIFPNVIDGDILKLVHLSNGFKMFTGAEPLKKGDVVSTTASLKSVTIQPSGKVVEVSGILTREGKPIMEVTSQFLYRGSFDDYKNCFQRKDETPVEIHLKSPKDVAVLCSKEWFELDDSSIDLLGKSLTFRTQSFVRFKNATVFSTVETTGQVLLELPTKEVIQIGTVNYEAGESYGNPVIDYLQRNGQVVEQPVQFENAIPLNAGTVLASRAPSSNEPYANVSGDYNPIHVSRVFAQYVNLPGTITHGMYSSAAVRSLVETWAAANNVSRVRAFNCSFVGMVLPNDDIETKLEHIGMINGRKIIKVESFKRETNEPVLVGEAEVEQPISSYVFTGQGSQEQGMGMDLYESSEVARKVWDRADIHFLNNYGFSIINIVKNNPKELTVHFGGSRGKAIRENYISMMFETVDENGQIKSEKIFKSITEDTDFYTFKSPTGLLSATQFTQPALTLMEKASFEDMKSKGLIDSSSSFAGHSLGEYSALASLGDVMPIESLVDVVFYRGMTMQVAVPRDSAGRSNYGMVAVNPSRVSPTFNDAALRFVVDHISQQTKWLLEIVNYNVENQQYVAAGDLRALDTLTNVLNFLKIHKINIDKLLETIPVEEVKQHLTEIVDEVAKKSTAKPQPIDLERGFAVIPLKGISVPFHSSYLRSGVKPFKNFLIKKVPQSAVKPASLINKYIPNLTAKPFKITKEYFQEVYDLTGSEKIKNVLDNWESYESS